MWLEIAPMDEAAAREILGWRYEHPYSFYNPDPAELEKDVSVLINPASPYFTARDQQKLLLAYYCFGYEAQVPGGSYSDDALDVGGGLHPELTGRGLGAEIIRAGLDFAQDTLKPNMFRVTVAAFNERALRVCGKLGFSPVQRFCAEALGVEFIVMQKRAGES